MGLLLFLLFGFLVGLIARALMPGNQKMGIVKTTLLGVVGSFVGGLLGNVLAGHSLFQAHSAGWIGSIVGAILLMAIFGRARR